MLLRDHAMIETVALADKQVLTLDDNGYLNVTARIARTGLQTYSGDEIPGGHFRDRKVVHILRPASEVFADKALSSFANLPITLGHPETGVSAANYKQTAVGISTGTPTRDGDYMKVTLSIRDAETVARIMDVGGMQISNGYTVDLDLTAGTTSGGDQYDAIQRNIRGNHIALVDAARCGPECRIGIADCGCASCQQLKGQGMSEKTIKTDEGEDMPPNETVETLKAKIVALEATIAELKGEIVALKEEQQAETIEKKVADRVALLTAAKAVLGDEDLSRKNNTDIRKAVITQKYGAHFCEDADDAALKGMFKIAVQDAYTDPINPARFIQSTPSADAAYLARIERLKNNYKPKNKEA